MVIVFEHILSLLEHGLALNGWQAGSDDSERFSGSMGVNAIDVMLEIQ